MQIEYKRLEDIIPYAANPRKNDDAVEYVARSINEFGFKVPIIIDKDGFIIAGHTRYKAAKYLGMNEVPVICADDLTEEQVKAFRLADNKVAEMAEWNPDLLDLELDELKLDFDMSLFGFDLSLSSAESNKNINNNMQNNSLADRFLIPPFSVIRANSGYWMNRKKQWLLLGIKSELGRDGKLAYTCPDYIQRQSKFTRGGK